MRSVSGWVCATAVVFMACDSGAPERTSARFVFGGFASGPSICYALHVTEAAGARWLERAGPTVAPTTLADALAAGALCDRRVPEETGVSLTVDCAPGEHESSAWVVGIYDGDGASLRDSYEVPAAPNLVRFTCFAGEETEVQPLPELTLMRKAEQGFFDIGIEAQVEATAGIKNACYALRVDNADGVTVWAQSGICSHLHGDGADAVIFVGTCDATLPAHRVTLWLEGFEYAASTPDAQRDLVNPCPAPADGAVGQWTGGCELAATCIKNEDVAVDFELTLAHAR